MNPLRLKAARERAGLTQAEVAKRLGVSHALPGLWERGQKKPSLPKVEAVAQLLNVSVSWLMNDRIGEKPLLYDDELVNASAIIGDYLSPPGLRDLAENEALVTALDITSEEWIALRSLKAPPGFTAHGYVAVLMAIRGNATES